MCVRVCADMCMGLYIFFPYIEDKEAEKKAREEALARKKREEKKAEKERRKREAEAKRVETARDTEEKVKKSELLF